VQHARRGEEERHCALQWQCSGEKGNASELCSGGLGRWGKTLGLLVMGSYELEARSYVLKSYCNYLHYYTTYTVLERPHGPPTRSAQCGWFSDASAPILRPALTQSGQRRCS
jgi:hypothetical protein